MGSGKGNPHIDPAVDPWVLPTVLFSAFSNLGVVAFADTWSSWAPSSLTRISTALSCPLSLQASGHCNPRTEHRAMVCTDAFRQPVPGWSVAAYRLPSPLRLSLTLQSPLHGKGFHFIPLVKDHSQQKCAISTPSDTTRMGTFAMFPFQVPYPSLTLKFPGTWLTYTISMVIKIFSTSLPTVSERGMDF